MPRRKGISVAFMYVLGLSKHVGLFELAGTEAEFVVPLLAETADEGILDTLVETDVETTALSDGTTTHLRLFVIVDGQVVT